jgi:hypothetical protein
MTSDIASNIDRFDSQVVPKLKKTVDDITLAYRKCCNLYQQIDGSKYDF